MFTSLKSWIGRSRGRRIAMWSCLVALLFGVLDLGRPAEDYLLMARNAARSQPASGDIVVIAVDDRSLREIGGWPWPRSMNGRLAEELDRLGARKIAFDIDFSSHSTKAEDRQFAASLSRLENKAMLAMRFSMDPRSGERTNLFPLPELRRHVDVGNINARHGYDGSVWSLPYGLDFDGRPYRSMSGALAGVEQVAGEYRVDYATDPKSIHQISAIEVLRGRVPRASIEGKIAMVGLASTQLGDIYRVPGHGLMPGIYIQALGIETLKKGRPVEGGWLLPFLLALLVSGACVNRLPFRASMGVLGSAAAALLACATMLEAQQVSVTLMPGLVLLAGAAGAHARKAYRNAYRIRGTTNLISGLPNLAALRATDPKSDQSLIVAKIHNYAEILSAFAAGAETVLVEQIAARLLISQPDTILYEGDDGVFAWFLDHEDSALIGDYLDGLHSVLIRPIKVLGNPVGLTVTLGFDAASRRANINRLGSALTAADEAAAEGLRWKQADVAHVGRSAWKLSLLSQLEGAIDAGDIWVAYQPKIDLRTMQVVGAEALARWSHPEKGPISPTEFVQLAEQSGRIEKLTMFVLDQAIGAAATVNYMSSAPFEVAVNISGRLIAEHSLARMVTDLLAHHRLEPNLLTLEITETAAISSDDAALGPLRELRRMGINIAIDDYGTGLSTLEYIRRMPASEIKIDRQFIAGVAGASSDRIMVKSTIDLAHSLGQRVVAEGVEDEETLELLCSLGCDMAQGFFTGRPMTYQKLLVLLRDRQPAANRRNG